MSKQQQLNIRIDAELYAKAKQKCQAQFGIGFFVGDVDLRNIFSRWLQKKYLEKGRKGCAPLPGPRLSDLYEL